MNRSISRYLFENWTSADKIKVRALLLESRMAQNTCEFIGSTNHHLAFIFSKRIFCPMNVSKTKLFVS